MPLTSTILKNSPGARLLERTSLGDWGWAQQAFDLGFGALTEVSQGVSWAVAAAGRDTSNGARIALHLVQQLLNLSTIDRRALGQAAMAEAGLCLSEAMHHGNVAFVVGLERLITVLPNDVQASFLGLMGAPHGAHHPHAFHAAVGSQALSRSRQDQRMDKNPKTWAWIAELPWHQPSMWYDESPQGLGMLVQLKLGYNLFTPGEGERTFAFLDSVGISATTAHIDGAMVPLRKLGRVSSWSARSPENVQATREHLNALSRVLRWATSATPAPSAMTLDGRDLVLEMQTLVQGMTDEPSWRSPAARLSSSLSAWETSLLRSSMSSCEALPNAPRPRL